MDSKIIGWLSATDGKYNVDICISTPDNNITLGYFSDAPDMELSSVTLTKENAQLLISFLNVAIDTTDKS